MLQSAGVGAGDYLKQANHETLVLAMIETQEALDNLDAIAAVPGLDGLFVGPSDLSIALSNGAKIDRLGQGTLDVSLKALRTRLLPHPDEEGRCGGAEEHISSPLLLLARSMA